MIKNCNKLAILSVILLVCAVLVLAAGFPVFGKILDSLKLEPGSMQKMKYIDISADFLLISFYAFLSVSVIVGITALFKIKKTKEKGQIVALLSAVISAIWIFSSLYAGWGLW